MKSYLKNLLPKSLLTWLLVVVTSLVIAILIPHAYLTWQHSIGWYDNIDQTLAQTRMSAVNVQKTTENTQVITSIICKDVKAIKVAPINKALQNVQLATANIVAVTGDAKFATGDIRDNWDVIKEGVVLSWGHLNDILGHVDVATLAEQKQQKLMADAALENMKELKKLIADPDIKLAISHTNTILKNGEVISEHYKKIITTPKRWWEHITAPLEEFGAKVAAYWI